VPPRIRAHGSAVDGLLCARFIGFTLKIRGGILATYYPCDMFIRLIIGRKNLKEKMANIDEI
jgi:hypothetical protein